LDVLKNSHQEKQKKVIEKIERSIKSKKISIVSPTENFDNDSRICLTSVHFPKTELVNKIYGKIIDPLKDIFPEVYYYKPSSLHMTIKNVRVISDPPTFSEEDVQKVKKVFSDIIPLHNMFNVYFFRLILFPNSLSLFGTTDPELDNIFSDLDKALTVVNVPDDKIYANDKYFISNVTLARFNTPLSNKARDLVEALSKSISFEPYKVDSVSLIIANASLTNCTKIGTWNLRN